jgi:hypothetical protein
MEVTDKSKQAAGRGFGPSKATRYRHGRDRKNGANTSPVFLMEDFFGPIRLQPLGSNQVQHVGEQTGKREQYDVLEEVEEGHFPDLTDIFFLAKAWILACHRDWSTIDWMANYPSHSMKYRTML